MIELYFAPGACSFVPHVALEMVQAGTGTAFTPRMLKMAKGEHKTPEYLALNPNGQVPLLVVDGRPLSQIVAICDWLDRAPPKANLLPADPWARAQALSTLAWMNNTAHPTFTHVFRPGNFAEGEAAQAEIRAMAVAKFRGHLERIQSMIPAAGGFLAGAALTPVDAYALTLFRWGGMAGIDPATLPAYTAFAERVAAQAPVAAALQREGLQVHTYKPA